MPGSSNSSSFIPKRGSKKSIRKVRNVNVYILTIVSYVLFFAALGASAGVFFYSKSITNQLNEEIVATNTAIGVFKEADLLRVEEFDKRLRQANNRLNNSASVVQILAQIESAVVDSLRLSSLSINRDADKHFSIEAQAETNKYDAVIFQRDILKGYEVVDEIEVADVALQRVGSKVDASTEQTVTLTTLLLVPLDKVAYKVDRNDAQVVPTNESEATDTAELFDVGTENPESATESVAGNEADI